MFLFLLQVCTVDIKDSNGNFAPIINLGAIAS